jgi:hypothetical protein
MKYKYAIGAGAGLLSNKLIQDKSQDFWLEMGTRAAEKRQRAYDAALKSGQTPRAAELAAEKADPLWRKLGSNRINGLATLLIGAATFPLDKKIGTGIMTAGAAKVAFPAKMTELESKF